jgi:hypothetical protein
MRLIINKILCIYNWKVTLAHSFREENFITDFLTKLESANDDKLII